MRRLRIVLLVLWLVPACEHTTGPAASGGGGGGTTPVVNHVFIVVEENTDYASVTSSSMPYLDSLAGAYSLATEYYADTHPSLGNYFMMTVGDTVTNDDNYSQTVPNDNIVRHLVAAGKTWKAYAEDLPSVGDTTVNLDNGTYASRHNPVVYLTDVHDNPTQAQNVVPFTQFASDLTGYTFPNYSFIVPNLCDDAHDCSLGTADSWLQTNIDPLVRSPAFQQDGLLIILFDESGGDNTNGGGRVVWVAVGSRVKRGYQSTTLYQHASTLRLTAKVLGLTSFPNQAASAPDMSEFFTP